MNCHNNTNSTCIDTGSFLFNWESLANYTITILAIIGTLENILFCITIYYVKRKCKFYNLLYGKTLMECLICLVCIGWSDDLIVQKEIVSSYPLTFYKVFVARHLLGPLSNIASTLEVFMSYDRYCVVMNKKKLFSRFHYQTIISLSLILSVISSIPDYLATEIVPSKDLYKSSLTEFGRTFLYYIYDASNVLVSYSLFLMIQIFMTVQMIFKYKTYILNLKANVTIRNTDQQFITSRSSQIVNSTSAIRKRPHNNQNTIRITIFTNSYYILVRFTFLVLTSLILLNFSYQSLNINIAFAVTLLSYSLNLIVYYKCDRTISNRFKLFCASFVWIEWFIFFLIGYIKFQSRFSLFIDFFWKINFE